jgi:hypothetical protein
VKLCCKLVCCLGLLILPLYTSSAQPLLPNLGLQAGMQDIGGPRVWILGPIAEFGPADGLQIRLGAELGVLSSAGLAQLETLILLNTRLGARIYFGGGVGVAWVSGSSQPSSTQIPLLALIGLKTRPTGLATFALEAVVLAPILFSQGMTTRLSVGVLFSL